MKKIFYMAMNDESFKPIEGYPFSVGDFKFFIHKNLIGYWSVSEQTSGYRFIYSVNPISFNGIKVKIKKLVKRRGIKKTNEAIRKAIGRTGKAPEPKKLRAKEAADEK